MLCRPDWKRTRQACGFCGAANPALPRGEPGRGGTGRDTGEGRSLLGCLGAVFEESNAMAVAGAGQVVMGRGGKEAVGTGEVTAVPRTPLAFQGDPGKGCESPGEAGIGTGVAGEVV